MTDKLITTDPTTPAPTKPIKLKPKQRAFIENWLNPASETFGNLYRSGMKAGFSPTYSINIKHLNPSWLSNTIEQVNLEPEHIKQGVQQLALSAPNSRSPDDTRLKAYELLGRYAGLDNKQTTTVNVVQPILNIEQLKRVDVDVTPPIDQ